MVKPMLVAAALVLAGCSSDKPSEPTTATGCTKDTDCKGTRVCERGACVEPVASDAAVDSATAIDSAGSLEAGDAGDTSGPACGRLPATFACMPFNPTDIPATSTSCTTEDVKAFIADCYDSTTASSDKCAQWFPGGAKHTTACGQCVNVWTSADAGSPNILGCQYLFLGGSDATQQKKCRDAWKCSDTCADAACNDTLCNDTVKDASGDTELDRCYSSTAVFGAMGACSTISAGAGPIGTIVNECLNAPAFRTATANCRISGGSSTPIPKQIEYFYRGACRDNGNWTMATTPM